MHKIINILVFLFLLSIPCHGLIALTENQVPIQPCKINRTDQRKSKISLCALFNNEAEYLKEWIEYHRLIGISHFYLYNNMSSDGFWSVLKPYVEQGVVELFDVPFDTSVIRDVAKTHNMVQVACYNHALKLSKKYTTWMALIDSDEYICPVNKDLVATLNKYQYASGLVVFWQLYGTSNVWSLNPGELLTEKLTMKFPQEYGENYLYKSIVNPKYATCHGPHTCDYPKGHFAVYPNHVKFHRGPKFNPLPVDVIRINHYTFRTESFYQNVKKPRRAIWGYNPSPEEEKTKMDLSNSTYDPIMLKFAPELHKRM